MNKGHIMSVFKLEIGTVIKDDKRDLTILGMERRTRVNYKGVNINTKWYNYICNKCKYKGWIEERRLLGNRNGGCLSCRNQKPLVGFNTIYDKCKWMIQYIGEENSKKYTPRSNKKVNVVCPNCGKEKTMMPNTIYARHINNETDIGCSCEDGISYYNKIAFDLLKQLNISFISEYSPNWIKPLRYDFYFKIENKKYILEMDGDFHYVDNHFNGKALKETLELDNLKDNLARKHNVNVIRVNCNFQHKNRLENIKNNILNSQLNNILDFNTVSWERCNEFALSNLVKVVCDHKKNNSKLKPQEISSLVKLSRNTVTKYLKFGTRLGWCNYDVAEAIEKSSLIPNKPIKAFKDGVWLGDFESASDLARQSINLYGLELNRNGISRVCRGERNHHKGFTFKYID